eukprot:3941928-Rhodomonas_salina.5
MSAQMRPQMHVSCDRRNHSPSANRADRYAQHRVSTGHRIARLGQNRTPHSTHVAPQIFVPAAPKTPRTTRSSPTCRFPSLTRGRASRVVPAPGCTARFLSTAPRP